MWRADHVGPPGPLRGLHVSSELKEETAEELGPRSELFQGTFTRDGGGYLVERWEGGSQVSDQEAVTVTQVREDGSMQGWSGRQPVVGLD